MRCAENQVGVLLYRLVLTGAVVPNLITAAQGLILNLFAPQFYDPPEVRMLLTACSFCVQCAKACVSASQHLSTDKATAPLNPFQLQPVRFCYRDQQLSAMQPH